METQGVKEVPSNDDVVTRMAFAMGAFFMTALTLAAVFAIWKIHIATDFRNIVGGGILIVVFASIMSRFMSRQTDPVRTAFIGNIIMMWTYASVFDAYIKRKPPAILDLALAVIMVYQIILALRSAALALHWTIPILLGQQLVLGASLYGLYHLL